MTLGLFGLHAEQANARLEMDGIREPIHTGPDPDVPSLRERWIDESGKLVVDAT